MTDLLEFRAYLSSTIEDITPERTAAIEIIRRYAVVKDSYRASEEGVVATCTGDVRKCGLYVGIIGQHYGWVTNPGENDPGAKSITELEYEACEEPGHPKINRLIFIRTTNPTNSAMRIPDRKPRRELSVLGSAPPQNSRLTNLTLCMNSNLL